MADPTSIKHSLTSLKLPFYTNLKIRSPVMPVVKSASCIVSVSVTVVACFVVAPGKNTVLRFVTHVIDKIRA